VSLLAVFHLAASSERYYLCTKTSTLAMSTRLGAGIRHHAVPDCFHRWSPHGSKAELSLRCCCVNIHEPAPTQSEYFRETATAPSIQSHGPMIRAKLFEENGTPGATSATPNWQPASGDINPFVLYCERDTTKTTNPQTCLRNITSVHFAKKPPTTSSPATTPSRAAPVASIRHPAAPVQPLNTTTT
jgi:hypothetical protein